MKPNRNTLVTLLNLVLLLSLILALAASALAQGLGDSNETLSSTAGTSEQMATPAPTPEPIDCSKPLPGKRTTLGVDDEILIAFVGGQYPDTYIAKYDNTSNTDANLKHFWNWRSDGDDLYQPRSVAITTADLDGDGKAEVVSAIGNDNPGRLEFLSIKNPEASGGDLKYDLRYSTSQYREGNEMGYIMAAAGGDLDGALGGDEAEEVAVAFQDDQKHLQVVLLDGVSDGGFTSSFMGYWRSSDHARYDMNDIAVDVGDLDGDGYDDEIVLALSDGDEVLQVIVLEYNGNGGLTELAYGRYSGASQVDVTTGVFSGDGKDQIAVAFRDAYDWQYWLNVKIFEYDSAAKSVHNLSSWTSNDEYRDHIDYVSVASGDIDGDRWDEIVIAFADRNDYFQAITLDADTGSLKFHSSVWGINAATDISYVSVGAGDIDGDGKAEVVASFQDYDDFLQVLSFDDHSYCPCKDNGEGLHLRDRRQENWSVGFTALAMGDVDGNNLYADYTGQCEETDEMRMIAVVNRPPYWEDLNPGTDVGYGTSIAGGSSSETEITNSYGSSVTFDGSFDFGEFEIGPSFSKDWEHSTSQSWTHGSNWSTSAGWIQPDDGIVALNTVKYYAYQYRKRDGSELARVSVPVSLPQTEAKIMTYWNESGAAQKDYADSWVPAYRTGWMDKQGIPGALNEYNQGAGSDIYDIDGNGKPDYLFAWIDDVRGTDVPTNIIYYRIGWDVDEDGNPASWSDTFYSPRGIGWYSSGLGAAVTELNGNANPELVVAWVDNPHGQDNLYYRIGWDLAIDGDAKGSPDWWSGEWTIHNWVGDSTQGAGLDILDISGDGRPDFCFGWIDNPDDINQGYYGVGWNLDQHGNGENWWTTPRKIEGAFGTEDGGLGLTVTDADGDGALDLVAAWGREGETDETWALGYSIGRNLQGSAYVDSWVPGHPIPGQLDNEIVGATVASADLVAGDGHSELVVGWIENPQGENPAYTRVGTCQQLGGEVDQRPTDIQDADPDDGKFKIKLYDAWWNVAGKVLWRWDEIPNAATLKVGVGGSPLKWTVDRSQFSDQTTEDSESYNYEVGGEAKFLGIGGEGSKTWGFEEGHSYTISWETGMYLDGISDGIPYDKNHDNSPWEYKYVPFTYMQEAMSKTGIKQAYMVLDYFVPWRGSDTTGASVTNVPLSVLTAALGITPGAPLIASPSHPDPDTWYATDTALFTWAQPAGDPAVVDGYRWYLDHSSDTIPDGMSFGLTDTTTYETLSDGQWWLHLRARGEGNEWSETAHRLVRVDAHPPEVEITLDPPYPTQSGDWYKAPVTAVVSATDPSTSPSTSSGGTSGQAGSGVASIEISTDGVTWQFYTDLIVFDTDSPPFTLRARATDMVGHVSKPVSTTFGLDMTLPDSVEEPSCWELGGDCEAGVISDTVGNQRLRLSGQLDASLSGEIGLGIEINGERWTAADEVGEGRWSFTSDTELGAGCHTFNILGEDRAGNVELLHAFGSEVVWHPRERPDLSGSSLSIVPDHVRPGDTVDVTVFAANSSWQETWVPISVLLPTGLDVLPDTISSDGVYNPAVRTITWPPRDLWPGQERHLTFSALVDDALPATDLNVSLTVQGTWPIAATCPADELPGFQDLQTTVEVTTMLSVDPDLPDDDLLPPASPLLRIKEGSATRIRNVQLRIDAADPEDARWMYLREWVWSSESDAWIVAQNSGWLPYAPSHPWTLSPDDGVKYLGVWLADAAWNVSALERNSLAFTNLLESNQVLSDGQRIQYRFPLYTKDLAVFNVIAKAGNPDIYVWQPNSGFRPHYSATGTGFVDTVGFQAPKHGLYLLEVQAEGDSQYQLLLGGDIGPRAASAAQFTANTPEHPLTVSDPLSAGVALAPTFPALYLPMMTTNH